MSEENAIMAAHQSTDSFAPHADVSTSDRSDEPQRRPEEQQEGEAQKPESLSDRHLAIDVAAKDERAATQAHKANIETLASELGVEDLHVPTKIAAYPAEAILKVLADYDFDAESFRQPAKVALMLEALEYETARAEEEELEQVRASLESEEEDPADEEDEEGENDEPSEEEEVEPKTEEEKPSTEEKPSSLATMTPEQKEAMSKHVNEVWERAQKVSDPAYSELFANGLREALGIPAEHASEFKAAAEILQFGAQNLLETLLPAAVEHYMRQNFGAVMESYAPGFSASYTDGVLERTWNAAAGKDLPRWGTDEFKTLQNEISSKHGYLDSIDFTHDPKTGKPLSDLEALQKKAELVASLCRNEKVTPQHFQQAIDQAKQSANRANRRVSAGRMLGRGKTTGAIGKEESYTSLADAYNQHHGNSFGGGDR